MAKRERIAFGKIGRPHGLRGEVRFFPYNDASPVLSNLRHGVLIAEDQRQEVTIVSIRKQGAAFHLKVQEIQDRDVAACWTNGELWVDVDAFPAIEEDDTYYHWQLAGLTAIDHEGNEVGVVRVVQNFGAGDMLVIRTRRGHVDVPFMDPWVGDIDVEKRTIVVDTAWLDPS